MNSNYCPDSLINQGVDLNRNYGVYYRQTHENSDQCSEAFAGSNAFSEKETQAIKNLIEKYP